MKLAKEEALRLFNGNALAIEQINAVKGGEVYFDFMSAAKYKSDRQNKTFHALLNCFWASDCASFSTLDKMREHYKRVAGLIKIRTMVPLEEYTKKCLNKAIQLLPISDDEKARVIERLQDKYEKELSWADAKKDDAKRTIDQLLHDMDESGVIGSRAGRKYQEILTGLEGDRK